MRNPEVRFRADSTDELLKTAARAQVGDLARVTFKGREVLLEAQDGGPLGMVWEEKRDP